MRKLSKLFENNIKYIVALILLAVPLYPKFPFIRVPGIYVSIRLEDFVIALAAAIWLVIIYPRFGVILKQKIPRAIVLYLLVGLASLVFAAVVTKTVDVRIAVLHWLRRIEYFLPFFIGMLVIRFNRKNISYFVKLLAIVVVIASIFGFGQRHFSWPIVTTQNQEYSKGIALRWVPGSHINATFAGHYDLATFLVMVLPIFISALFLIENRKSKLALIAVIFPGLWLLVNTASRISVVSYMIAVSLALVMIKRYKMIPVVVIISVLFLSISAEHLTERYLRLLDVSRTRIEQFVGKVGYQALSVYAAGEGVLPERRDRPTPTLAPPEVFEDRSTSIRFNVEWPRAIRAFTKNPILGTGYSSITLATDSEYLRLLGEVGIAGFFAFGLIFFRLAKRIYMVYPIHKNYNGIELAFIAGYIGAIPGILLNAVFIDVFEASKFAIMFWLLTGFVYALIRAKRNEKSYQ